MKIEKAIEILTLYDTDLNAWNEADNESAVQLGIEALKRFLQQRPLGYPGFVVTLPGETQEEEDSEPDAPLPGEARSGTEHD